jgi:hypothetical protein
MGLSIAGRWFERQALDDGVTLLREPHVHAVWRCNIWHVRGRDRDLLIDTGIGVASLLEAAADLFERPLAALATHAHVDHVGGLHEFDERIAHAAAAERLAAGDRGVRLAPAERGPDYVAGLAAAGYDVPDLLLDALPTRGYDVRAFAVRPAPATRLVGEGDVIDLGDRRFTVLHLPFALLDRAVGGGDRHAVLRRRDLRRPAAGRPARIGRGGLCRHHAAAAPDGAEGGARRPRRQLRPRAAGGAGRRLSGVAPGLTPTGRRHTPTAGRGNAAAGIGAQFSTPLAVRAWCWRDAFATLNARSMFAA